MPIYKYCPPERLDILKNRKIKASRAEELNDPFELAPIIDPSKYTRERAIKILRSEAYINDFYFDYLVNEFHRQPGALTGEQFTKWFRSVAPAIADRQLPHIPDNIENARLEFAPMFSAHYRLLCFSKADTNILMWSHYAKDHTGLVIEFDEEIARFDGGDKNYRVEVEYEAEKEAFWPDGDGHDTFLKALFKVVARKAKDWEYEAEVRFVVPTFACRPERCGSSVLDFFHFKAEAIRGVTLGTKFPGESIPVVLGLLNQPTFSHVRCRQAVLSRSSFKLEFLDIDPQTGKQNQAALSPLIADPDDTRTAQRRPAAQAESP